MSVSEFKFMHDIIERFSVRFGHKTLWRDHFYSDVSYNMEIFTNMYSKNLHWACLLLIGRVLLLNGLNIWEQNCRITNAFCRVDEVLIIFYLTYKYSKLPNLLENIKGIAQSGWISHLFLILNYYPLSQRSSTYGLWVKSDPPVSIQTTS